MGLLAAVLLCLLIGWEIVCLALPTKKSDLLLTTSLSVGCGLGVFSLIYFLVRLFSVSWRVLASADLAVALALAIVFFLRRGHRSAKRLPTADPQMSAGPVQWSLRAGLLLALLLSVYGLAQRLLANPNGEGWDAFAIWNLHARFLFLSGDHWREGFTNLIPWSHPDYPLLLPGAVAHFWTFLGDDSVAVPAILALLFTLATVGVLTGSLIRLRGDTQATLAGIVLLGTPFFLEHGVSQYADVTLGYFILAAIVLVWLSQVQGNAILLTLSGLMAGFAAWTKNEGQLFVCAFLVSLAIVLWRDQGISACIHDGALALAGLIPVLTAIIYFKISIAPPGDLFAGNSMLVKAADAHRYWYILRWYVKEFFLFGHWLLIPGTVLILAYGYLMGRHRDRDERRASRISVATLALTLAGYFAIFVITPRDLRWHLRYSLNRLFLQLWPSALFIFFMLVRTPDEAVNARGLRSSTAE